MGATPDTDLRPLGPEDLDRVVEIDRRLVGRSRRGFFEKRLAAALRGAEKSALPELMAEDLRLAVRALGRITGRIGVEDILDVIFAEFCIGK